MPVIFGDATLRQTLESARVDDARAVAVLTQDDMVNIETGIVLREMLGPRVMPEVNRPDVPVVLRVYDRALGAAVAQRFGFENVRSTVELAAPWFIGAAMGLQVLGTFSVGQRSFMVGGMQVAAGQRTRRAADVRDVHPDPRHRDHPAGRAGRSCTRAATPGCAPATPPTWSGRTASCWTRCAKGQGPQQPEANAFSTSRRKGPHFRGVSGTFAAARARPKLRRG